jgi:GTP pyrophosphokinase
MNEVAKKGYASGYVNRHTENIYRWVNSIKEILDSKYLTNKEILEIIRPQPGEIYAISPKGDIIILPKDSTVLDYAFQIHTDFGLHFQAAEVNGKIVSYNHILSNADQVTIFRSSSVKPQQEWINSLASHRNKNILIEYFRKQKRKIINQGEKSFKILSKKYNLEEDKLSLLINKLHCDNRDDFFYKIGNESVTENDIFNIVKPKRSVFGLVSNLWSNEKTQFNTTDDFNPKIPFLVKNLNNISLAKCCKPIDGDPAIIYRIDKNNFIIHRNECEQAKSLNSTDGDNTAKVKWDLPDDTKFRSTIVFSGLDNKGLLFELIEIISKEHDMNMSSLKINVDKNTFNGSIDIIVSQVEDVMSVLKRIRKIKYIKKAFRLLEEE